MTSVMILYVTEGAQWETGRKGRFRVLLRQQRANTDDGVSPSRKSASESRPEGREGYMGEDGTLKMNKGKYFDKSKVEAKWKQERLTGKLFSQFL